MMSFEHKIILDTVNKLLNGNDYRSEIVDTINSQFFDFSIQFFKDIVQAKLESKNIDLGWYKARFITNNLLNSDDIAIYSGMNKKTITNIRGSAKKEIVLDMASENLDYLANMIEELNIDSEHNLNIQLKLTYNSVNVDLTLSESLLVINALATKKIAIRGGAWSSIGKKVEKPLMVELCKLCNVPIGRINSEVFKKDGSLDFDREVDFKLYSKSGKELRCEVKLIGRGNPESADTVIARDANIFIADTLSDQNKAQLSARNVKWLELKNHSKEKTLEEFCKILTKLDVL